MALFAATRNLYNTFLSDMGIGPEAAGFFLADYIPGSRTFELREWRPIPPNGFESRSDYHLVLTDEAKVEIIRWGWDAGASLVEAHAHRLRELARFSASDIEGLNEWVPHLMWRLGGRPYGAIVVDGRTIDTIAWIDSPANAEQVDGVNIQGEDLLEATCATLQCRSANRRLGGP